MGDSITYGFPYSQDQSWFNIAAKEFRIEYYNKGINGDTTSGMLNRFAKEVILNNPSHVIIMGGTNDAYCCTKADCVLSNIKEMVELALQHSIMPIIGLPIPCNDSFEETLLSQYREKIREFAIINNVVYIDFHKEMADRTGSKLKPALHCDGIHPSVAGYRKMADTAISSLIKITSNFTIYKPSKADYPCLIKIWEDSVRATHNFITEEDINYYKPLILNNYFDAIDLYCYKDRTGKIVGFIGLDGDKVEMLFIDPAMRNTGIGKKLLTYAITKYNVIKVDVNEQNEHAVGFYQRMGFRIVNRSDTDACGKNYPILSMEL
ncbi:GNAT family N-acetyltransferase [Dendrosporobacter sp. 1207_IL3150]|uniref:GNAT family N-acetyltransferase n=1 Tax=Dendrosporobacter sp. 1207_IL3150 TaxID=3084054 RepID=UPI002FDB8819